MALIPIKLPQAQVFAQTSKWQAVHHPVVMELQRQDQQVTMKYKPGSLGVRLKMIGSVSSTVVGQEIKYFQPNGDSYTWTVTAVYGSVIVTDGTIPGTVYGGFVIYTSGAIPNYVNVDVYRINVYQQYELAASLRYMTDVNYRVSVPVQEILRSASKLPNTFDYDAINKTVEGEGGKYELRYYQYSESGESVIYTTDILYWTNSAKQPGDVYGSNMGEYVPTIDATRNDPDKAKFMTVFDKPTYFVGFPFSLSFIYSDNLTNIQITREEEHFDLNGSSIDTASTELDYTQRFAVNRLMIKQGYSSSVKKIQVWLESGSEVTESEIDGGTYALPGVFEPMLQTESPVRPAKLTK